MTRGSLRQAVAFLLLGSLALGASAALAWSLRSRFDDRPATATAAQADPHGRARLLYQVHCTRCHGPEGRGDGPDAALLQRPPRDFGAAALAPESIRRAIVEGVPSTPMAAFGPALSTREIDALTALVGTLAPAPTDLGARFERAGVQPAPPRRLAPPLNVRDLSGKSVTLDGLRGRVVLVAFWGTACASCLKELPDLERLAARFEGEGLTVLPVCVDETDPGRAREAAGGRVERLPLHIDADGLARLGYDVQALPTAVLIDRSGHLLGRVEGAREWDGPELAALLRACLARRD